MSASPRLDLFARVRANVVAGIVLLCQAAALVHAAAAPHVTCPEHGDGMHLGAGADRAAPGPAPQAPAATVEATADEHQHDHCRLQHQGRSPLPAPDSTVVLVAAPGARAACQPIVPASIGVLCFAPKTSPPRTPA